MTHGCPVQKGTHAPRLRVTLPFEVCKDLSFGGHVCCNSWGFCLERRACLLMRKSYLLRSAGPVSAALNSLTSPGMVAATLACLGLGGRLAEISKRDIWSPARVAQERPDVAYSLIAIDFLPPTVPTSHASCLFLDFRTFSSSHHSFLLSSCMLYRVFA